MGWRILHRAGLAFCCRSRLSSNVRPLDPKHFMRCNIPGFLAKLSLDIDQRRHRITKPLVAVDENLGGRSVSRALRPLLARDRIASVVPLWYEMRFTPEGERAFSPGSLSRGAERALGLSSRQGWKWDDESIVCNLVAQFSGNDQVVFLTADRGTDPKGIRSLLNNVVQPALSEYCRGRLGLLVIGQIGTTPLPTYLAAVTQRLEERPVEAGFSELWI